MSRQAPYGVIGIYGAVAVELRLLEREGFRLTNDCGLPLAEAFISEPQMPATIQEAVREDGTVSINALTDWGERAFLSGASGKQEAAYLRDALHRDPVRSRMCRMLARHPARDEETELERIERMAHDDGARGEDRDLRETLIGIAAYEACYRLVQLAFERLL